MKRRTFVKSTAVAGGGLLALQGIPETKASSGFIEKEVPTNTLGRTGAIVSKIGIGAAPLGDSSLTDKDVVAIFNRAAEAGVNYIDVAPNYANGRSEKMVGVGIKGKRDKFFLVTKTESATYEGTWELLKQSLENLQTDYIDMVHLHNIGREDRFPKLEDAFSKEGAMGALREAKQKGIIRHIGASGHLWPSRFHFAIDSGEIDAFMMSVNFINQHTYDFEHKVWARAHTKNMGLIAMKVLGGKKNNIGAFNIPIEDYDMAMRYALSLEGLSTAVIGIASVKELDQAIDAVVNFKPFTEDEAIAAAQRGLDIIKEDPKWRKIHGDPLT